MLNKKDINEFARKYYALYSDSETTAKELEDGFGEVCFSLGFKMDCGSGFIEKYSGEAFEKSSELIKIIETVDDPYILGNAIFSYWRKITHWYCESLLNENNQKWMVTALKQLIKITTD